MTDTTALTTTRQDLGMIVSRSQNPTDAIDKAGAWFAKSGLFGCDRTEQGAILALTCISENISPIEFSRTYDICEGKLRKKAMAAFADFRKKGGKVKWLNTGDDGKAASAEFTFEGQTVALSFSIEQAKLAGLVKPRGGWEKNPGNMLRARVISNALGMLCPEIYAGEYDEDERPQAPAPQINLAPTAAAPVAPAAPVAEASPTIDVQVVEPAPITPAPAPTAAPELSVAIQEKLVAAIGAERIPAATAYVRKVGWIGADDSLEQLPEKRANQILARVDRFLSAIAEGVAK